MAAEYQRAIDLDDDEQATQQQRRAQESPSSPASPSALRRFDDEQADEAAGPPPSLLQRSGAFASRRWSSLQSYFQSLWIGQKLAVRYLLADTRRDAKGASIGVFTVLLVVMLVALLENNVSRSPMIFWRIAETTVGENDLLLTAGFGLRGVTSVEGASTGGITNVLLKQQYIEQRLAGLRKTKGATGRWLFFARVLPMPPANGTEAAATASTHRVPAAPAANGSYVPPSSVSASAAAYMLGINSGTESAIGLGRTWPFPPLVAEQIYLTRSVVREIGLDPRNCVGTRVILRLDLLDVAQTLNAGGIGGGDGTDDAGLNTTHKVPQSARAQAEQESEDDASTPEQTKGLVLKVLLERAYPNLTTLWDQPVALGPNTDLVIAFVELLNSTISSLPALPAPGTGLPPAIPPVTIPPEQLLPIIAILQARYNVTLTPEQVQAIMDGLLAQAQIAPPPGFDPYAQGLDPSMLQLDPALVSRTLSALRNRTETYGDLLAFATPFLLQVLRVDAPFTIAGVVEAPEGKWAEALGSVIVLENAELMKLLSDSVEKVINLQSRINMSAPLPPVPTLPPMPPGLPPLPPLPSDLSEWPLERVIDLLLPSSNASRARLHATFQSLDSTARSLNSNNFSLVATVQYASRLSVYLKTLDDMTADLLHWTNILSVDGVGFDYPLTYTLPLQIAMKLTIYIRYFLDNIFGAVIALLVMLGMGLVYSLLLNDAQEKTYEYGMLRALGMKHQTLVQILLSKSFGFSVFGIGFGLLLAFLANIPLAIKIAHFAAVDVDYRFLAAPILLALALGLVMPALANMVPISRALGKTLRDSLDVYHLVQSEVLVRIVKLQELGIDLWQTALSLLLIIVGFVVFFIVPYAFTFNQIPMFLGILNAILLAMLLGMCIIASLLQPHLEKLMLRLMLWLVRPHSKLYSVVSKNLSAHRSRNSKTSQMFLICLAFLVFAGVMFNLQSASLTDNLKVFSGADLQIYSPLKDQSQRLRETQIRAFLDDSIARRMAGEGGQIVDCYTFVSYPLNNLLPVSRVAFSSLPQFPLIRNSIWGVEANYLDVAYDEFFHAAAINSGGFGLPKTRHGQIDVVRIMVLDAGGAKLPIEGKGIRVPEDMVSAPTGLSLTTDANQTAQDAALSASYTDYLDVLVSESLVGAGAISIDTPLHLHVESWNDWTYIASDFLLKSRALVIKLPGFFFSSYRQTARMSSVVMGMPQFTRVMKDVYGTFALPAAPPKQKLLIRLVPGASRDDREDLVNALRIFFRNDQTRVIDTLSLISTMDQAVALMNLFFTLVGAIAMIMCFFILWLSFTANVHENAWEFGVLRAIGLNSVEVVMIYVYEALALVLASVLLGTLIGLIIAATLTLQFGLFTELPFRMQFPVPLFVTMLVMAFVVAIVGSALPAYGFLSKTISTVLRRQ